MPFVNVIRGDTIPTAPLNVRTPVVRLPLWMVIPWETIKALVWLLVAYVRFWWVTLPSTALLWLYAEYGWPGPVGRVHAGKVASACRQVAAWHRGSADARDPPDDDGYEAGPTR